MSSDKRNEELLREASANGDEDGVRALLDSGVNINSQHSLNGWTGLHWAAKRSRVPIVRLLLSQGADPSLTSVYGETALSLANNDEICSILSGSSDSPPEHQLKSALPITPNYLSNPSLVPRLNVKDLQCPESSYSNSVSDKRKLEEELVLKVRTAESDDPDFIEIEIPVKELTYENVFRICCKELDIAPKDVLKLRKLPNTVVRKDKDVLRFQHFQELELVLNVRNTTVTSHTLKNKLSHTTTFQETNHSTYDNNSETNSPLVKKSNYCKNGTILY